MQQLIVAGDNSLLVSPLDFALYQGCIGTDPMTEPPKG